MWPRAKSASRVGLNSFLWGWTDRTAAAAASPAVQSHQEQLHARAFWPTTLDKECDKAARILRSFCKDGFHSRPPTASTLDSPKLSHKALKRLPEEVIRNAKGLAIFTTMRSGLWISGAGGS